LEAEGASGVVQVSCVGERSAAGTTAWPKRQDMWLVSTKLDVAVMTTRVPPAPGPEEGDTEATP
jgi:hypothetical protein